MPGLSQLKKLSEDVIKLGDEPRLRAARGEKPAFAVIPSSIPDVDDSEDFVLGMPVKDEPALESAPVDDDNSSPFDETPSNFDNSSSNSSKNSALDNSNNENSVPDMSDLLNPIGEADDFMPDLSAFEEPEVEPEPKEPSIADMSLDDLLSMPSEDFAEPEPEVEKAAPDEAPSIEDFEDIGDFDNFENLNNTGSTQTEEILPNIEDFLSGNDFDNDFETSSPAVEFENNQNLVQSEVEPSFESDSEIPLSDEESSAFADFETPQVPATDNFDDIEELEEIDDETENIPLNDNQNNANQNNANQNNANQNNDNQIEDLNTAPKDAFQNEDSTNDAFSDFDDFKSDEIIDLNADLPEEISEGIVNSVDLNSLSEEKLDDVEEVEDIESLPADDSVENPDELPTLEEFEEDSDFDTTGMDDFSSNDESKNDSPLAEENSTLENSDKENLIQENEPDEIPTSGGADFDALDLDAMDDFSSLDMPSDFDETNSAKDDGDFELNPEDLNLDGLNLGGDDDSENSVAETSDALDSSEMPDFDFSSDNLNQDSILPESQENPNNETSINIEDFDTSGMDGIDFGTDSSDFDSSSADASSFGDFNIPDTDSVLTGGSDFELDLAEAGEPDFEIAGYTGESANPFDESGRMKSQLPPKQESKQKNTLSDSDYKKFRENLNYYPLNVRLAIEDLIVKNELTDDAIFEVVEKVIKKIPVRQLASHLEKLLDIQLSVPRDFERRTVEEYETYKASLQYQLKNRILPALVVGIFIFMIGFCSVYLGAEYVVKPIHAEILYKQGYNLLENDEYPQSEIMFNRALELKQKKNWFFKYAEGYRNHKQFDRAELMYKNILRRYNHDKIAGLEYAKMELNDLVNYSKAESIVRREILDHHINDTDAILLLGDIYLEWGTEDDPSKFQDAYEQYSLLLQLPKTPLQVDARMMVYNVRTDNLKGVLTYKEIFFPNEKSLNAQEWTEMSGYLMDKLYGNLAPAEEYLRASIEDVYSMLVRAIKFNPENPVSRYNMARYYIETGNHDTSINELKKTINLFDKAEHIKKRDLYKQINTYRLLGEQYLYTRDFILSKETLATGIDLFEEKNQLSGFESDKQIGIMYSDMADIDYFIDGDLENAERNYINSVNNKNDNPSIRYKLGYINYGKENYNDAIEHFLTASNEKMNDDNLNLSLANCFSLKDDNFTSVGYYERLLDSVELKMNKKDLILPQLDEDDTELVNLYMKVSNNLGVGQYRIAKATGDSYLNGKSLNNFQNSLKAWDTLTRNPVTMVRLNGTNLAEQNIKYSTSAYPSFEPAIYTEISRTLQGEKILE